jgi:hypothetical protein
MIADFFNKIREKRKEQKVQEAIAEYKEAFIKHKILLFLTKIVYVSFQKQRRNRFADNDGFVLGLSGIGKVYQALS